MKNVIIQPDECWKYFLQNREEITKQEQIIAEEPDYGIEICISNIYETPAFTVYIDEEPVCIEYVVCEEDCAGTLAKLYGKYIDDVRSVVMEFDDNEDWMPDDDTDLYEEMVAQEDNIAITLNDFLTVLVGSDAEEEFTPVELSEITDRFCSIIAEEYGKNVYRPMIIEDEYGNEEFVDCPYN